LAEHAERVQPLFKAFANGQRTEKILCVTAK
jgi:hypothetical protein